MPGKVNPEKNADFHPEESGSFNIKVNFRQPENKKENAALPGNIIENGKTRLIFENGKTRLIFDDNELTKKLGMYTSLRSNGRWHDSVSTALWKIEENGGNFIKASGKWLYLPIKQAWELRLDGEGIGFKVRMIVLDEVAVDRLQANLMLSERFTRWMSSREKGAFPDFKADINDDWDSVWSGSQPEEYAGANFGGDGGKFCASVKLFAPTLCAGSTLNIVNSDLYHRGRLLQYLDAKKQVLRPCEFEFFSGKIIVSQTE
jgi:hypothetical protein